MKVFTSLLIIIGCGWLIVFLSSRDQPSGTLPKATGAQTKIIDKQAPQAKWISNEGVYGMGDSLAGEAVDLGSGVGSVAIQIQRQKDGLVWNGQTWQPSLGEVEQAVVEGRKFSYLITAGLMRDQIYLIRAQAIDRQGNTQAIWPEIKVIGRGTVDLILEN